MLVEKPIRQIEGDLRRRLMADADLELIVWYSEDDSIFGFELTYGTGLGDHCFRWTARGGSSVSAIDWGDGKSGSNRTPILVQGSPLPKDTLVSSFHCRSEGLEKEIKDLVSEKLEQYDG